MKRLLARIPRPGVAPATPFGPDSIEVHPRALRVGDSWCRTFAVTGYPREVGRGWLEPLCAHPGRLDVALHIEPVPPEVAADRLRRQLARLESARRADAAKGRLADPDVDVAAEDAQALAAAGVSLAVLDGPAAARVLAGSLDPAAAPLTGATAGRAGGLDEPVTLAHPGIEEGTIR